MPRVPYPGNVSKDIRPRTRRQGGGFKFEVTKPLLLIILCAVVFISMVSTYSSISDATTTIDIIRSFAKFVITNIICAGLFILVAYIFFDPYRLFNSVASLFGKKRD